MTSWRQQESEKQVRARYANELTAKAFNRDTCRRKRGVVRVRVRRPRLHVRHQSHLAAYESVRVYATHFAIAPDHENPESERVIAEGARFAVIETVSPEARSPERPAWWP